jgi:light-regulated signal transduction histidine kinase (bacteriophytochrome)
MGQHVVDVRTQDEDGDVDPTPATLAFIVPPVPLQSRSWFVPLIVVAMGTFVGLTMLSWVGRRRALAAGVALDAANAELDAFNYGVSHDLNAPLRNLERLTAQLRERPVGEVDAAGLETLARIQSLAVRMQRLVDGLRDLSSITRAPIVRTPLELGEIARSIAADLAAADPLRRVRWTIQPRLITEGDPNLVPNLLRNLLENAWKFTRLESDAVIEVGAERLPRRRLAFFVRDNGIGFDPALADRLFVPFQRLHGADEFPGDGIGLATVRRVVSRHGGRVWAEAAVGRGATFYFTLEAGG